MVLINFKRYKDNIKGEVYGVSLKDNNISSNREDLKKLIGKDFIINNIKYILKGFSAFWDYDNNAQGDIAMFILFKIGPIV